MQSRWGSIDHVGIGTDFDGRWLRAAGPGLLQKGPALTRALLVKCYTANDIKKIYGGNLLRVKAAVEKRAAELRGIRRVRRSIRRNSKVRSPVCSKE